MRTDLALRHTIDSLPHARARISSTTPLKDIRGRNAESDAQSEGAARVAFEPRAKAVVPRDHVPDIKQEQLPRQLVFWPNLHNNREAPVFIGDVEHNPDPVTEFIRERLRLTTKEDERGAVQSIEKRSGLGAGHVFRIKNDERQRVTSRTAQSLAPILGWPDYGDFLAEVVRWWKEEGQKRIGAWSFAAFAAFAEVERDAELRVAIEMAKGGGGTVPEIVKHALTKFRSEIGTGEHDRYWWVARFGESARIWQQREAARLSEKKTQRKAARELARARKEAPESSHTIAGEIPPPSESAQKLRAKKS